MIGRPLIVVTDHLAEAGVERPLLESVADVRLLQTSDAAATRTCCGSITTSN
jgi:hypothetical protein